jgi:hypothetical protein
MSAGTGRSCTCIQVTVAGFGSLIMEKKSFLVHFSKEDEKAWGLKQHKVATALFAVALGCMHSGTRAIVALGRSQVGLPDLARRRTAMLHGYVVYVARVRRADVRVRQVKAMTYDPSLVHEYTSVDIRRAMGVPVHRIAWTRLYINGKFMGIYNNLETISNRYLHERCADSKQHKTHTEQQLQQLISLATAA